MANVDTPTKLTTGLFVVRVGYWLLVLGAIPACLVLWDEARRSDRIGARPGYLILAFLCLFPGTVLDLIGRYLCCQLPASWRVLRPLALWSLFTACAGIALIGLFALDRLEVFRWVGRLAFLAGENDVFLEQCPRLILGLGQLACGVGWLLFVELLRRVAQRVHDERLFWRALTVMGLWTVCAVVSVGVVLGGIPGIAGIAVALLGILLLYHYEMLLSKTRAAVHSAVLLKSNPHSFS